MLDDIAGSHRDSSHLSIYPMVITQIYPAYHFCFQQQEKTATPPRTHRGNHPSFVHFAKIVHRILPHGQPPGSVKRRSMILDFNMIIPKSYIEITNQKPEHPPPNSEGRNYQSELYFGLKLKPPLWVNDIIPGYVRYVKFLPLWGAEWKYYAPPKNPFHVN